MSTITNLAKAIFEADNDNEDGDDKAHLWEWEGPRYELFARTGLATLMNDIPPAALAAAWRTMGELVAPGIGGICGPGPGFKEAIRSMLAAILEE